MGATVTSGVCCCQSIDVATAANQRWAKAYGEVWQKPEPIAQPRLNTYTQEELEESFDSIDLDGSGTISETELASLLDNLGVKFTAKSLFAMYRMMDSDANGTISKQEFMEFFNNRDKNLGLKKLLAQVMAEKMRQQEQQHLKKSQKKLKDVFILHGLSENDGLRRSFWLLDVLEFADLTVTGAYVDTKQYRIAMEKRAPGCIPEAPTPMTECGVVCLLIDRNSLLTDSLLDKIHTCEKARIPVIIFFEADGDAWDKLFAFREHAKHAFKNKAVPISKHFLSDSENLVLEAVHKVLKEEPPQLRDVRPPGGDLEDFSCLNLPGTKWLRAEYAMTIRPGMHCTDLPSEAFCEPGLRRTCFISYAQEDKEKPGLSVFQHKQLKEAIKRNMLGARVFFMDHMSLEGRGVLQDYELTDVFSLSRFVILSDLGPSATDKRPYLKRGKCFLEALICLLTGSLAPHRENQFVDLDNELGAELGSGMNLRKYVRTNADNPYKLVNKLCNMLNEKHFENQAEQLIAEKILRRALERHPLLVMSQIK